MRIYSRINFTNTGTEIPVFFYLIDTYFNYNYNYDNSDPVAIVIKYAGLLVNYFTNIVTGVVYDA